MSLGISHSPTSGTTKIKIKSPKNDIKVYKLSYETSKKSPGTIPVPGVVNQTHNDDMDKITQAWNRLKINALSKAIAISPEVRYCSIGPRSGTSAETKYDEVDGCYDKLDLDKAVTSTPMKPKKASGESGENKDKQSPGDSDKQTSLDLSEIKSGNEENQSDLETEMNEAEKIKILCRDVFEEQLKISSERKKEERYRLWLEHQELLKEKEKELIVQLERERNLRIKKQIVELQNRITESKASSTLKKTEQQKKSQLDHNKKVAESNEKMKQLEQKRAELEVKQRQRREELKLCINGIHEMQVEYNRKYNQIGELAKSCRSLSALNEKVSKDLPKLKAMNEFLLKLFHKCEEAKVGIADLRAAERLVQDISTIKDNFAHHTDEINKSIQKAEEDQKRKQLEQELKAQQAEQDMAKQEQELRAKQAEEELKARQAEQEQQQETSHQQLQQSNAESEQPSTILQEVRSVSVSGIKDCISSESLKWHLELKKYLEDFEEKLKPLLNNDSLKKYRFDCQCDPISATARMMSADSSDGLRLSQVVQFLTSFAPLSLAEEWDNVGLLVEPTTPVAIKKALLTIDLTEAVMKEAVDSDVNLIIAYHPPLFMPFKRITQAKWKERLVATCLEHKIAVFSPHTSWDAVKGGLSDWLASPFDFESVKPLLPSKPVLTRPEFSHHLLVFCPPDQRGTCDQLLSQHGAEILGTNLMEHLVSYRAIVRKSSLSDLETSLSNTHCHFSVHQREPESPKGCGTGRIGKLKSPISISNAVDKMKTLVEMPNIRIALQKEKTLDDNIKTVALVAGSGASVLRGVKADLYVTGEMLHHDLLDANHSGASVVLINHSDSERGYLKQFGLKIGNHFDRQLDVCIAQSDKDPIQIV